MFGCNIGFGRKNEVITVREDEQLLIRSTSPLSLVLVVLVVMLTCVLCCGIGFRRRNEVITVHEDEQLLISSTSPLSLVQLFVYYVYHQHVKTLLFKEMVHMLKHFGW